MDKNKILKNVRMVLNDDFPKGIEPNLKENSWEILDISNMNSFVFPKGENHRSWKPKNVDIAIVFETILDANETLNDKGEPEKNITCPSFLKQKDYFSSNGDYDGIAGRPCGFITPRGTIMPMMIIPTDRFIQNGIVKHSSKNKTGDKKFSVLSGKYGNCFNWTVGGGDDGELNVDNLKYYGNKITTQEDFSFVSAANSLHSGENEKIKTRIYRLEDEDENGNRVYQAPLSKHLTKEDLVVGESLIFGDYGGAFAFVYKFNGAKTESTDNQSTDKNKKDRPSLNLSIGPNVEVTIPQSGQLSVEIAKQSDNSNPTRKTEGTISSSKTSQKMGQMLEKSFEDGTMVIFYPVWNGIAVSGGIDDSSKLKDSKGTINVTVDNGFIAFTNIEADLSDFCKPQISEYPTNDPKKIKIRDEAVNTNIENPISTNITYDSTLVLRAKNCLPSFAYTPVFFQKNLHFSIYIKENNTENLIEGVSDNFTKTHYLYPIYYNNNNAEVENELEDKYKGELIEVETGEVDNNNKKIVEIYHRFDFKIDTDQYARRGVEIFGFVHQVLSTTSSRPFTNSNGIIGGCNFSDGKATSKIEKTDDGFLQKFNGTYNYGKVLNAPDSWLDYALSINVNRSNTQSGGTITLDKYALVGQFGKIDQPVGEVRLKAVVDKDVESIYKNQGDNVYFSGLGIGISDSDAATSDTFTLNLSGIEKKLQDIKLAGAPFFDGDPFGDVMDYLREYANFKYECFNDFHKIYENGSEYYIKVSPSPEWMVGENAPCPRSTDFKRPAINFLLGTTVYEAISQICEKTNKTFFITKTGMVRVIDQNIYGIPVNVAYSLGSGNPTLQIKSDQILSINIQPYLENVYNQVITASLRGKRKGGQFSTLLNTEDMMPNIFYSDTESGKIKTNINFPWSRMIVNNELAILSKSEAKRVHEINCNQFATATFTGSITIPGNSQLEIFDTIQIVDTKGNEVDYDDANYLFYITNISHNYESSTRVWTTTLQVTHIDTKMIGDLTTTNLTVSTQPSTYREYENKS